jgi:hypothetical protein
MPGDGKILSDKTRSFYLRTLATLNAAEVPYVLGGAYSLEYLAGVERHTKDLDIFVRPADRDRTLAVLADAGYRTEIPFPHWLAKAHQADGDDFIDVIYRSGNGLAEVDDEWFAHAVEGTALGVPARLCPAEEIVWSKAFVMERERFDGADIAHLILARGREFDWDRLLRRFGPHWRVLLAHLTLFGYIYPREHDVIPARVMTELADRLRSEAEAPGDDDSACQGTLLSRSQYLVDMGRGYLDARVKPRGPLTTEDIEIWTAAIERDGSR